jgi:hypothetical protein
LYKLEVLIQTSKVLFNHMSAFHTGFLTPLTKTQLQKATPSSLKAHFMITYCLKKGVGDGL